MLTKFNKNLSSDIKEVVLKENLEYTKMAEFYDLFYKNKNYEKESHFIEEVIKKPNCSILDAGCGTGNHLLALHKKGYDVFGFDINKEMLKVAETKLPKRFEKGDLLTYKTSQKFDLVISFFAVFNHLKSFREFFKAVRNLKQYLSEGGKIIIDLHNPQKSGEKTEKQGAYQRKMKWRVCKLCSKEFSSISYKIVDKQFETKHTFAIFKLKRLKKLLAKNGYTNCDFYENYDTNTKATSKSKNIQVVINF